MRLHARSIRPVSRCWTARVGGGERLETVSSEGRGYITEGGEMNTRHDPAVMRRRSTNPSEGMVPEMSLLLTLTSRAWTNPMRDSGKLPLSELPDMSTWRKPLVTGNMPGGTAPVTPTLPAAAKMRRLGGG